MDDHSYMITAKLINDNQYIVQGIALSLEALKRVLDFIDEYAENMLVSVEINSALSKPLNTVNILTPDDYFNGTGKMRRAALIVLEREGYDDYDDYDDEDYDDYDDEEDDDFSIEDYSDPFDDN